VLGGQGLDHRQGGRHGIGWACCKGGLTGQHEWAKFWGNVFC
jgi:hypothetical protein